MVVVVVGGGGGVVAIYQGSLCLQGHIFKAKRASYL